MPFLLILAVLGIALGSVWYLTKPVATSTIPASQSPAASTSSQQPSAAAAQLGPVKTGVPGAEPANTKGPANARVHIEEFGDFQCPPCAAFHPMLEKLEKEFPKDLRVTFRNFPLPTHQHALRAASAAEAAGLQGKFWEMHKLIYEHQNDWKGTSRPLRNTVGVLFTPIERARLPSRNIRCSTRSLFTSRLNRSTSMPICFA